MGNKIAKPATTVAQAVRGSENKPAGTDKPLEQPQPGLDAARHAASQRSSQQAEVIRQTMFPALMADALGFDKLFDGRDFKAYLERLLADAGNPTDPVEVMLLEQMALAHFRIGQLHATAGRAKGLEATKILNGATSRMLGEFRRTAITLRAYRSRGTEGKAGTPLKLFKAAK